MGSPIGGIVSGRQHKATIVRDSAAALPRLPSIVGRSKQSPDGRHTGWQASRRAGGQVGTQAESGRVRPRQAEAGGQPTSSVLDVEARSARGRLAAGRRRVVFGLQGVLQGATPAGRGRAGDVVGGHGLLPC